MSYIKNFSPKFAKQVMDMGRKFTSDKEFNNQLKQEVDYWKKKIDGEEEQTPYLFIFGRKNDQGRRPQVITALALDLNNQGEKRKILFKVGAKMAEEYSEMGMSTAILMSEAWMRKDVPEGMQPGDFDNKQEVIVFIGQTIDGRMNMAMIPVERDDEKKMHLKKPHFTLSTEDNDDLGGDLLDYLFMGWAVASKEGDEKGVKNDSN